MSQAGIYGTSLAETLSSCMVLGNQKAIQQLKTDFKMQDKHMWYVKLRTLGAAQDWEGVVSLAREKRSPIPASAFVNLCLRLDAPAAATARCAASLRHNPRPCLKCHEDVSALRMWCGGG